MSSFAGHILKEVVLNPGLGYCDPYEFEIR